MNFKSAHLLLLLLLQPAFAVQAPGNEVVAVLSSKSGVYLEAFTSFQDAFGAEVPAYDISIGTPDLPSGTRFVVAFGAKAAAYEYPPGIDLVYCLSPGFIVPARARGGRNWRVAMSPSVEILLHKIMVIQPKLKRLGVLWTLPIYEQIFSSARERGLSLGVEIVLIQVGHADRLPAVLREYRAKADSLYLPPDPQLITPGNIAIIKDFSWANGIPLYAPTRGLVSEGAVASVGVSFAEAGRTAAEIAKQVLAGDSPRDLIFPREAEVTLNLTAAKNTGLRIPEKALKEADHIFP